MNDSDWKALISNLEQPLFLGKDESGQLHLRDNLEQLAKEGHTLYAQLPPCSGSALGHASFREQYQSKYAYIAGEMANGIASADMVIAMANAGMLGSFGSGGLIPSVIEENLQRIQTTLSGKHNWMCNLIHSPNEPSIEEKTVELLLKYDVRHVCASAFTHVTPNVVHFAAKGLKQDASGVIHRERYIMAKISHPTVAKQFIQPPRDEMLASLAQAGQLSSEEVALAKQLPIASDITVEADSGGHTDNRSLTTIFPIIQRLVANAGADIRVGAGGGLSTPEALAAAFSMGAAYVVTGSINQACVEADISAPAKEALAMAQFDDIMMAAAADMFEAGVKLQVLKRGSLFPMRANKLYEIYKNYESIEKIPEDIKSKIEKDIFKNTLEDVWRNTESYFQSRDPAQVTLAQKNPKYKMALIFRWYLGLSSRWAIQGDVSRKLDYQIWCGPAMGAFNQWVENSHLAPIAAREVATIGKTLMEKTALHMRLQQLSQYGLYLPRRIEWIAPNRDG